MRVGVCPAIGIRCLRLIVNVVSHHPPVVIATWMVTLADLAFPRSHRHSTELDALERWRLGEVDIQADPSRQSVVQHSLHDVTNIWLQRTEISVGTIVTE